MDDMTFDNYLLDLTERDINLLQVIDEEELTNFTFEGVKRKIKLHSETLSRILHRLTEQKILKKEKQGYTLTNKAKPLLIHQSSKTKSSQRVLETYLPLKLHIQKITQNLKGKWFGQLRYLGYSITEEDVTIKWITQDGKSIISAIFSKNKLYIDAKIVSEDDQNNALNASHELMSYISKLISKTKHN